MKLQSLGFILFLSNLVAANEGSPYSGYSMGSRYLSSCQQVASHSGSWCKSKEEMYSCYCSNENSMATVMGCIDMVYEFTDEMKGKYLHDCEEYYNVTIDPNSFATALQLYKDKARNTSEIEGFNATVPIDYPVKVEKKLADLYVESYMMFLGNYNDSLYYGSGLLGYWLVVLLGGAIVNWSKYLFPKFFDRCTNKYTNAFRKYVTVPAVHKSKTDIKEINRFVSLLVPSRFETIVTVGFLAVTIACQAANLHRVENDPIFPQSSQFWSRMMAIRSGILTSCMMPLLILFAGRNNFLQWLTRWDFATFIAYHRWVSRIVVLLVIIHSVCYSITLGSRYKEDMKETYLVWGTIGTTSGGLILIQGMHFLRTRWYEIFLLLHIILAVFFVAGAWLHVDSLGYVWFYYATAAVWIFDRAVRVGRLVVFGFPKSEVILLANETLKVIVPRPKHWVPIPGGHAFVHFIRPSCFWQSHPFTFTEAPELGDNIVLYCKVKGGVTHGLYQYLANHPGRTAQMRVAIEGPYGEPSDSKHFDTAVFVAGGNGIPGIYSEAIDLALKTKDSSRNTLKLIWIVREYKSLYWFYQELLALKNTKVLPIIYVTNPTTNSCIEEFECRIPKVLSGSASDSGSNSAEEEQKLDKEKLELYADDDFSKQRDNVLETIHSELSHVEFREGRPDIDGFVKEEIKESQGSTAFITCGHPMMVDQIRYTVAHNLDANGHRVEFFEKLQVWA